MQNIQKFKPLTVCVFVALLIATYYDWYWPWGLLFMYWAVPSLMTGEAFLIERVTRAQNPILFWLITGMWVGFGVWTVYEDLLWRLA